MNVLTTLPRAGLGAGAELPGVAAAAVAEGLRWLAVPEAAHKACHALWAKDPAARDGLFLAGGSPERHGGGARRALEAALDRLDVDALDLWVVEDLRTDDDLDELLHPGGAIDSLERAQAQGLVRALGVSGAADPRVLARAVELLPLGVVMGPVNPAEAAVGAAAGATAGFLDLVAPAARARGMGVVGTHVLDGGRLVQAGLDADALLRFAFAQPADVLAVGCRTAADVAALAAAARAPMAAAEAAALVEAVRPRAGQLATWRRDFKGPC